jgi:hypothetical protein
MNTARLRSRIEALVAQVAHVDCPKLLVVPVYEDDDPTAVRAALDALHAKWPGTLLVVLNKLAERPAGVPLGPLVWWAETPATA